LVYKIILYNERTQNCSRATINGDSIINTRTYRQYLRNGVSRNFRSSNGISSRLIDLDSAHVRCLIWSYHWDDYRIADFEIIAMSKVDNFRHFLSQPAEVEAKSTHSIRITISIVQYSSYREDSIPILFKFEICRNGLVFCQVFIDKVLIKVCEGLLIDSTILIIVLGWIMI
jgi:hypothetical protein